MCLLANTRVGNQYPRLRPQIPWSLFASIRDTRFLLSQECTGCWGLENAWEFAVVIRALILPVILLTSCATADSNGVPSIVSKRTIETMAAQSWADLTSKMELSNDEVATARFYEITRKTISASDLSDEDWDIRLFDKQSPNIFSLPGYRIGGHGIDKLSDDRIASMAAFVIASLELKHNEQMVSGAMMGRLLGGASKPLLVGGETPEAKKRRLRNEALLKTLALPTPEMRKVATVRAEEIVNNAGFSPDFLISTNFLNHYGPLK